MITIYKTNSMKSASQYVLYRLQHVNKTDLSVTHTVIVPDRASLEAERALLKAVGGSFNVQVRTFRRLANEILPKYGYLSKQAGIMALTGIIQDNKDKLVCYTKGVETSGFVADMYDTISMMKYCKISPENLAREDLPKGVVSKAHDIALLYRAYLDYTAEKFIDSADKLDLLCEQLPLSQAVKNGYFYLYDFDNFSKQELALVEQLMKHSLGVTVACCVGEKPTDGYLYLNDIYDGVVELCKNLPHEILEGTSHQNKYVQQIGEHLFRYDSATPIAANGFVETFQGATRVDEVYNLACKIQRYIRNGGRFRDIYVVTSDVNKYYDAVQTVFPQFDIPYFCDRQFALSDHPYARYVVDYLTLCRNNARLNYVLPFVKNYLFCGSFDDVARVDESVFLFENYCLKYNVSYNFEGFELGQKETFFQAADAFRAKFQALYSSVQVPPSAPVSQYVAVVRNLIAAGQLNEKTAAFAEQQHAKGLVFESKVTVQVQQKFEEVLYQAEQIFGERTMNLDDFIRMLTVAVGAVKISVIPVANDCVVFANMAKARKHDIKFLALLGANFGVMPIVKSDCKLLSDRNLQELSSAGIEVEPKILTENRREKFSLFQLLQEPSQQLYVSCAASDGTNSLQPSQFVSELSQLFTQGGPLPLQQTKCEEVFTEKQALAKVVENSRKLQDNQPVTTPAFTVLEGAFGEQAKQYQYKKDGTVTVNPQLFLPNGISEISVTQLTDFFKCPYRFFLRYGLEVSPREVAELSVAILGTILHKVFELFVKELDVTESDDVTEQKVEKYFVQALSDDKFKSFRTDSQFTGMVEQLRLECQRVCKVIKRQFANSEFVPFRQELFFGPKANVKLEVDFETGKFLLKGVVDRVDGYQDKNGNDKKFVVVDYKSGSSSANYTEKDLYTGLKMQLLVYVKAAQSILPQSTPAGFYYFHVHDNFSDAIGKITYAYTGRTLKNEQIACKLDKDLSKGNSERLGLVLNGKGEFDGRRGGRLLTSEQIDNQVEYAMLMVKQAGKLMSEGYANISPYVGSCEKCDFRDVCDFNDVLNCRERKVSASVKKETIDYVVNKCRNLQTIKKT